MKMRRFEVVMTRSGALLGRSGTCGLVEARAKLFWDAGLAQLLRAVRQPILLSIKKHPAQITQGLQA